MKKTLIAFLLFIIAAAPVLAEDAKPTQTNTAPTEEIDTKAYLEQLKANETSLTNKTIDAGGIGVTGTGAMMTASALSEQAADSNIEKEMAAYLATFRCEYGSGKSVRGGENEVELPGGNDMFNLYAQYATLANDLKIRKESLGIKPGIESEIIIDKADTGLYDDVGTGIIAGSYVSVARALMNPTGADAIAWNAQKEETAEKLRTGIQVAATGAVGSLLANMKYNREKPTKALKKLETQINSITPEPTPCPADATGEQQPNCNCGDKHIFNANSGTCDKCPDETNQIVENNTCKCPAKMGWSDETQKCETLACTPQCDLSSDEHLTISDQNSCACDCKDGYKYDNESKSCYCPSDENHKVENGSCKEIQVTTINILEDKKITTAPDAILEADKLFENNSSAIKEEAQKALKDFAEELIGNSELSNCALQIDGYADPTGSAEHNKILSTERADNVSNFLLKIDGFSAKATITTEGHGMDNCYYCKNETASKCEPDKNKPVEQGKQYPPCRRVEITGTCLKTTTTTTTTQNQS